MRTITMSLEDRLKRLSLPADGGCLEWRGSISRHGYGVISVVSEIRGVKHTLKAHRVAYEVHSKQKIPPGLFVCHKCDNKKCINFDHLFLGTRQDNVDDWVARGRHNHKRKISLEDLGIIRSLRRKVRSREVAARYGISHYTVQDIWRGAGGYDLPATPATHSPKESE